MGILFIFHFAFLLHPSIFLSCSYLQSEEKLPLDSDLDPCSALSSDKAIQSSISTSFSASHTTAESLENSAQEQSTTKDITSDKRYIELTTTPLQNSQVVDQKKQTKSQSRHRKSRHRKSRTTSYRPAPTRNKRKIGSATSSSLESGNLNFFPPIYASILLLFFLVPM